jgi:hypothetical protein
VGLEKGNTNKEGKHEKRHRDYCKSALDRIGLQSNRRLVRFIEQQLRLDHSNTQFVNFGGDEPFGLELRQ